MKLLINNRLISQLMFSFKKSRFANTTVFDSLTTVRADYRRIQSNDIQGSSYVN